MARPKGSPNKITAEIKERLSQVIMDAMSTIDIDSMTQNEKLKLIQIGLTYVIPRLKQVENISEEEEPRKFEIEIIDSLSKYSDKELDEGYKGIIFQLEPPQFIGVPVSFGSLSVILPVP